MDVPDERSEREPADCDPKTDRRGSATDPHGRPESPPSLETGGTGTDASPELVRTFWILVLVVDLAILAIALGAMLLYFRGDTRLGAVLVLGGIALSGFAVRRYRAYRHRPDDGDGDGRTETDSPSASNSAPPGANSASPGDSNIDP